MGSRGEDRGPFSCLCEVAAATEAISGFADAEIATVQPRAHGRGALPSVAREDENKKMLLDDRGLYSVQHLYANT